MLKLFLFNFLKKINKKIKIPAVRVECSFLFEMIRDRRTQYSVQLTQPPLTEIQQCAFVNDSYLSLFAILMETLETYPNKFGREFFFRLRNFFGNFWYYIRILNRGSSSTAGT